VILDADLAELYGVTTREIIQAVKRNVERFPKDFMFQLTGEEGVAMLSSVLHSPRAVHVNVAIMRAFVGLRRLLGSSVELARRLDALERKYNERFEVVFQAIRELMASPAAPRRQIGFQPKT